MKTPALIAKNRRLSQQLDHLQQSHNLVLSTYYEAASGFLRRTSQYILVGMTKNLPPGAVSIPAHLIRDVECFFQELHIASRCGQSYYCITFNIQDSRHGYSITNFLENSQLDRKKTLQLAETSEMILHLSQSSGAFNAMYKQDRTALIRYSDRHDRLLAFPLDQIPDFEPPLSPKNEHIFRDNFQSNWLGAGGMFLGNVQFFKGNFKEAINHWSFCAQYRDAGVAYYNIASAHAYLGDIQTAYQYSLKAVDNSVDKDLLHGDEPKVLKKHTLYKKVLAYAEGGPRPEEEEKPQALQTYLETIWSENWPTSISEMDPDFELMLSFAYGIFGFADGSHAPRSMLMGPGLTTMKDSLLHVIKPMLKPDERSLLNIPIEIARVPYIDAAHVFDKKADQRWIVLNLKLFGALYAMNDRFLELLTIGNQGSTSGDPLAVALKFPELISRFFLGTHKDGYSWMFRVETRLRPDLRDYVWAHTSMQQVFLLLHELGHAYHRHGQASAVAICPNVSAWQSSDSVRQQEIEADCFAARHMAVGPWPKEYVETHETAIFSLFEFFESLELLHKMQRYSLGVRPEPRERFQCIASEIDHRLYKKYKPGFDEHQSTLDDVFTAWSLNQEV